jgi:sugar O-acyltransferase (sialic acid O-acetyltransferase NeuD family)
VSDVIIFGADIIAEVVFDCLTRDGVHRVVAFTVDREFMTKTEIYDLPVVPFDEVAKRFPCDRHAAMVAIGYHDLNALRARRCADMKDKGYRLISHCGGCDGRAPVPMGENAFVMDHRSLQPGVSIGDDTFVWSGAAIGHHSTIGSHCWITSGSAVGGGVRMGDRCFIGLGAVIGHGVTLGEACFLGAGSQITKDAADGAVFVVPDTEKHRLTSAQFMRITRLQ